MKKWQMILSAIIAVFVMSACGTTDDASGDVDNNESQSEENVDNGIEAENEETLATPKEPTESDMCAFCNMVVYDQEHEMGVFSAQAVNADGENIFFDDSGCLLNMERKTEETFETKWVRDYVTDEWLEIDDATVVYGDFATPMKYGYAFFKDENEANKFIEENSDLNAVISSWEDIDNEANERYMKKMQNENGDDHDMHDHHEETDHEDHE